MPGYFCTYVYLILRKLSRKRRKRSTRISLECFKYIFFSLWLDLKKGRQKKKMDQLERMLASVFLVEMNTKRRIAVTKNTTHFCYLFSYPRPLFVLLRTLNFFFSFFTFLSFDLFFFFLSLFPQINTSFSLVLCHSTVAPGKVIRLDFRNKFYIEPSATCEYDYLEVTKKNEREDEVEENSQHLQSSFSIHFWSGKEENRAPVNVWKSIQASDFFNAHKRHIIEQSCRLPFA